MLVWNSPIMRVGHWLNVHTWGNGSYNTTTSRQGGFTGERERVKEEREKEGGGGWVGLQPGQMDRNTRRGQQHGLREQQGEHTQATHRQGFNTHTHTHTRSSHPAKVAPYSTSLSLREVWQRLCAAVLQ